MENNEIPSRHEMGDKVFCDFIDSGKLKGFICGIKFTDHGKVLYDIKLFPFVNDEPLGEEYIDERNMSFILKDIDSLFIKPEFEYLLKPDYEK